MTSCLPFHTEMLIYSLKIKIIERGIGSADYSYRYQLQPIVLIIGRITRMANVSVQLTTVC